MNQIQSDHIIPLPDQKMLKFDGLMGTYAPALPAAGALGHIVSERSLAVLIVKIQCRSRTIFYTGQAAIAFFINSEIRHVEILMMFSWFASP